MSGRVKRMAMWCSQPPSLIEKIKIIGIMTKIEQFGEIFTLFQSQILVYFKLRL